MWMKLSALALALALGVQANSWNEAVSAASGGGLGSFSWENDLEGSRQAEKSPDLRVFNDRSLLVREYGFGVLGGVVSGALGFFIGSGLESAIQGNDAMNGTLDFTGIRYDNFRGSFYGGAAGIWLGSALTSYFVGAVDEEEGSTLWTLFGGAATTAGAMALASAMGVNDRIDWPAFVPLIALPATGSTLAFNVSRYFSDKRRQAKTETAVGWQAPRLQMGWVDQGSVVRLDAMLWTFH